MQTAGRRVPQVRLVWDANTGHMNSWTSNVGSKQQSGSLTWNVNGSLYQLQLNDSVSGSSDTQTCTYGYDDVLRVSSASCGTHWGQTFTYDPWGNINKAGSIRFSSQGGTGNHVPGFTYDADGNVQYDTFKTYTYNIYGRPASVGGTTAVYDAFNRLVEVPNVANAQIVYAPGGVKFAYMNGQTVQKYLAPLAAGAQAVYTAATPAAPAYWLHSDWLGSAHLGSTVGQSAYGDQAYGPFGETYDATGSALNVFTGQTSDMGAVAGASPVYDFLFRQYSATQGRWMVPDPAGMGAVDITNPQTWNRYAYVANNPLNATDPQGLYKKSLNDIDIPLPTFCPGIFGCGSSSSFWSIGDPFDPNGGFPDSGAGNDGTPDCGSDGYGPADQPGFLGPIAVFYSGAYSGVPTQMQMNNWSANQFWSHAGPNPLYS